jgi:hypothetical protein
VEIGDICEIACLMKIYLSCPQKALYQRRLCEGVWQTSKHHMDGLPTFSKQLQSALKIPL